MAALGALLIPVGCCLVDKHYGTGKTYMYFEVHVRFSKYRYVLVQNQVTPCRVCEFRGLENLRMHGIKGRRPLENWVFQSEKCSKNTLVMGDFN